MQPAIALRTTGLRALRRGRAMNAPRIPRDGLGAVALMASLLIVYLVAVWAW
jgi:hypothetical protein